MEVRTTILSILDLHPFEFLVLVQKLLRDLLHVYFVRAHQNQSNQESADRL